MKKTLLLSIFCLNFIIAFTQSHSDCNLAVSFELDDLNGEATYQKQRTQRTNNVNFTGTVEYPDGRIQYSRLLIYDPVTYEVEVAAYVCIGGNSFDISVPAGVYNIYYRPFQIGARPYEIRNFDLTQNVNTTLVLEDITTPEYFDQQAWSNLAVYADGNSQISMVAEVNNAHQLDEVYYFNEFGHFLNSAVNYTQAKIVLRDDGLGNDETAGDGIFTSVPMVYNSNSFLIRSGNLSIAYASFFQVKETNGDYTDYDFNGGYLPLGLINPNAITSTPLTMRSNDVYANDYIVNIIRPAGEQNATDAQTFYQYFADRFDFINIFHANLPSTGSIRNYHFNVRNDAQGLGYGVYDNSTTYGSTGKLRGISVFPALSSQPPTNHEVLHQWSSFLHNLFGSNNYGSHHGLSSIHGVHGGLRNFEYIDANTVAYDRAVTYGYASDRNDFADLELYLMGAMSKEDLRSTYYVIHDPVSQGNGTYSFSSLDQITPDDIVNEYGLRMPNGANADTDFCAANIVISDEPLTGAILDYYTYLIKSWGNELVEADYKSFEEATQGLATMNCNLTGCSALAIEFTRFEATKKGEFAQLYWNTHSNEPMSYFLVQRSSDGKVWENIQKIKENNVTVRDHTTTDTKPYYGTNYYRIVGVENDGSITESPTRLLNFAKNDKGEILKIFPNPTNGQVSISWSMPQVQQINLYDLQGKQLKTIAMTQSENLQQQNLDLTNFPKGVYWIKIQTPHTTIIEKIIHQ